MRELSPEELGAINRDVADIGLSVVYEPGSPAIIDIVFVHGLQGHPFRTWAAPKVPPPGRSISNQQSSSITLAANKQKSTSFRTVCEHFRMRRKEKFELEKHDDQVDSSIDEDDVVHDDMSACFWPKDLLPTQCPGARILTWGYDTNVTRFFKGASNKNNVLSHGKDLLFGLRRDRLIGRPIIFIAHSLGGIVVKEMLSAADASDETEFRDIVMSTSAVVFLGTPHRGSLDMAKFGQLARKAASAIGMDTNSKMLDALSLKVSDLERCQESFSRLWTRHDFRVKTFQEALPLVGLNIPFANNKIVPDFSSLLGDAREHAETLQANHRDMCRFSSSQDPSFRKVAGEIENIYSSIVTAAYPHPQSPKSKLFKKGVDLSHVEKACLRSLHLPNLGHGRKTIKTPAQGTCEWLFNNKAFKDWHSYRNADTHHGLIWIRGNPGSGKSTLMREAYRRSSESLDQELCHTAAFFFDYKDDAFLRNMSGLLRSLICQIFVLHQDFRRRIVDMYREKVGYIDHEETTVAWDETELQHALQLLSEVCTSTRITLFIDALDECDDGRGRELAYFFRDLTEAAYQKDGKLQVCLSSRNFGAVTISRCPIVHVDTHNRQDILLYLHQRLDAYGRENSEVYYGLKHMILERSSGIFLWVILVVDMLLKDIDQGRNAKYLESRLSEVPQVLQDLYREIVSQPEEDREATLRFFQWVILAGELRLREWYHILPFIRRPTPSSLQECQERETFAETDEQLERQIRHISMGLVEVTPSTEHSTWEEIDSDCCSVVAGAGSLDFETGETRVVRVIHESIRYFFLRDDGFNLLNPYLGGGHAVAEGHMSIMSTCLDFLEIEEIDELVNARLRSWETKNESDSFLGETCVALDDETDDSDLFLDDSVFGSDESDSEWEAALKDETVHFIKRRPSELKRNRLFESRRNHEDNPPHKLAHKLVPSNIGGSGSRRTSTNSFSSASSVQYFRALVKHSNLGSTACFDSDKNSPQSSNDSHNIERNLLPLQILEGEEMMNDRLSRISPIEHLEGSIPIEYNPTSGPSSRKSEVLEDYPALLLYITTTFSVHALSAQRKGGDIRFIFKRLQQGEVWKRFQCIHETIPLDNGVEDWAMGQGLYT